MYDYIISIGMLEHITDYDDLYKKTAGALNPGGQALMHSIYSESWFYKSDRWFSEIHFPVRSLSEFSFQHEMLQEIFQCCRTEEDAVLVVSENARARGSQISATPNRRFVSFCNRNSKVKRCGFCDTNL